MSIQVTLTIKQQHQCLQCTLNIMDCRHFAHHNRLEPYIPPAQVPKYPCE